LKFRRAHWLWHQFLLAFLISPAVILVATIAGVSSGDRTEYVLLGAIVGLACIRGVTAELPDYRLRAGVALLAAAALGPVMGLVFHLLRYTLGFVELTDGWEIGLSLEDGYIASMAGVFLMMVMVSASFGLDKSKPQIAVETGRTPIK
jgi:hypothetical protein